MGMPAPKLLDDVIAKLNDLAKNGKKPGDIDRYHMEKAFNDCLRTNPVNALIGLAILASIDENEIMMRKHYKNALKCAGATPISASVWYNYGLSLSNLGFPEESAQAFECALDTGDAAKPFLDSIAFNAVALDNGDLMLKTLSLAKKLECSSDNIQLLEIFTGAATADDDQAVEILAENLSYDSLKRHSRTYSEKKWHEMSELAEDLKKYI